MKKRTCVMCQGDLKTRYTRNGTYTMFDCEKCNVAMNVGD